MKMNKLIAMLFAGGLTFSGAVGAIQTNWFWKGPLGGGALPGSSWKHGNVGINTIGDTDVNPTTTFTLDTAVSGLFDDSTDIVIGEYENTNIPGILPAFQKVQASADSGITGTVLAYTVNTSVLTGLNRVSLDAIAIGGGNIKVTKDIYNHKGGEKLFTLTSENGRVPVTSYDLFTPDGKGVKSFYVVDTIVTGDVRNTGNEFASDGTPPGPVTAPEIDAMAGTGALTLLASALALAGERRRRKA